MSAAADEVADELARSRDARRAAEALLPLGLYADAVSRAYYAAFHCVRALLLARGVEPKSHAGAIHLLNVEYVRPGTLDSRANRLLSGLQRMRELADYDASVVIGREEAEALLEDARAFESLAMAVLDRAG